MTDGSGSSPVADDAMMERAAGLARRCLHTHPNPRVGAVIVSPSGQVVGEGWHRGPGTAHAEVVALNQAADQARGSTVYVTLEPCSHHGRTPPCADALIDAGVARVVVGTVDPDKQVSGSGVERLRTAGIEVATDLWEDEARQVDPAYFHHREIGAPQVTLKWAMTLDGSTAATDGSSQWITGEEARADVHVLRSTVDAVVVGAGTLRHDDPRLDVRIDGYDGAQPRPVIVSGREELPTEARIWDREPIVVSTTPRPIPSGDVIEVAAKEGLPDPAATCQALADRGLLHLLVEGGPTLAGSWWRAGVVTDGRIYIGARIGGGTGQSPMGGSFSTITRASDVEFGDLRSVGDDVALSFRKII